MADSGGAVAALQGGSQDALHGNETEGAQSSAGAEAGMSRGPGCESSQRQCDDTDSVGGGSTAESAPTGAIGSKAVKSSSPPLISFTTFQKVRL